jgi:hypothetical protein
MTLQAEKLGLGGPLDDGSRAQAEGTVWLVMNATYGMLQVLFVCVVCICARCWVPVRVLHVWSK